MIRRTLQTERLGPLPIINHFVRRTGLDEALDRHVPSDLRCAVPHARALGVLLRSIIVEREPIYRQQETVHGFANGMFGIAAEEMAHLCDDRIGRALDRLFDADRTAWLTDVVVAVGERFGIEFAELHNAKDALARRGGDRRRAHSTSGHAPEVAHMQLSNFSTVTVARPALRPRILRLLRRVVRSAVCRRLFYPPQQSQ
jgi:hypothetical protein